MKLFETRNELLSEFDNDLIIAELGVFRGEFSKFIHSNLNPKKLYLVDLFSGHMGSGDKDGNNMVFVNLNDEYKSLNKYFENHSSVEVIQNYSGRFLSSLPDEHLDIVYIDADHEYDGVKQDLNLSFNKVKSGGYICGHDYVSPRFEGVVRAVNEFCDDKHLEINYLSKDGCPTYCIKKKIN